MKSLVALTAALILALAPALPARAAAGKIVVVAAENFYGDVARQIGGERVSVTSILNNPDEDPHLFETSPDVVRRIAGARIVIYNGADYDPWMAKLLDVTPRPGRVVIVAADLVGKKAGDNPHLWYDPPTMPAVARAIAADLAAADPAHRSGYAARLDTFLASLGPLNAKIAAIGRTYAGAPVAATEPVFGYMASALKLDMHEQRFQIAVMNDTEPSARDLAAFERDLKTRKVRALFYNKQVSDNLVDHLVALARAAHIPVVGVTEICPPDRSYQAWIANELDATAKALAAPAT
ncbi:MAG: metal ABC transporter solute-binding protein, Zn/Mn family [Xanthobacteraceae bacterium]